MPRGLQFAVDGCLVASVDAQGQYCRAMEITELPPTPLVLPAAGELVHIRTQEWALERWDGEDPPGLSVTWGRKPKFSVNGSRSCAELAIVYHLRADGWDGVWVNAFRSELRTQWFPAPAAPAARRGRRARVGRGDLRLPACRERRDAERLLRRVRLAGAPPGRPFRGQGRADRMKPTQLRFVEIALCFRRLEDFMIVEVAGPSPRRPSAGQLGTTVGQASGRRPVAIGPRFGGRDLQPPLRRPVPAGPGHYASREQRPPGAARWTADDVIEVASCGDDAAAIARNVTGWAAGPHLRLAGGTGPSYPSFTVEADSGRTGGSRWRGVLALYASPHGGPPALEVRVKTMCRTPPYNRQQYRSRLTHRAQPLPICSAGRITARSRRGVGGGRTGDLWPLPPGTNACGTAPRQRYRGACSREGSLEGLRRGTGTGQRPKGTNRRTPDEGKPAEGGRRGEPGGQTGNRRKARRGNRRT